MKAELYEKMLETELKYIKCFSDYAEQLKSIIFKYLMMDTKQMYKQIR